ncbi:MAG: hypothetical protein C5B50_06975 [Verrucomicrobia bacterium]|nr:MAG: hypothetical protein C5B50_06975 [Verrucomicrobiota bacterium]
MKPPPFLLGACLLFWGWQTGFMAVGALMGAGIEWARWSKARWEFADEDFSRIWTFCTLLFLATAVYAFTASGAPGEMRGMFERSGIIAGRNAAVASARTAASLIRWLPMVFFPFVAMQAVSSRDGVPIQTMKLVLGLRWKKAKKVEVARIGEALGQSGGPASATLRRGEQSERQSGVVNVMYPYLALCLFAASVHPSEDLGFFAGLSGLVAWGLWPQRSRRFGMATWTVALLAVVALGYEGQRGFGYMQRYLENINPRWFSRFSRERFDPFQSKTALGTVGRLKLSGEIVVRVETANGNKPPPLLREASYNRYQGQTWYAAAAESDFDNIAPNRAIPGETSYILLPAKTNTDSAKISCYLPGGKALLPLPTGSGRLENLPVWILGKNKFGAVMAQGPGLVMFDALYGPGTTIDSAASTNEEAVARRPAEEDSPEAENNPYAGRRRRFGFIGRDDTERPKAEIPALDQIVSELHLDEQDRKQKLRTLSTFFAQNFQYSTWQGPEPRRSRGPTNETALTRFLLRTRRGHCEYFATAAVLLLRHSGTPARYAVGYAVHEPSGHEYVVRQRDAHAWCLVWNKERGLWQDYDPTPGTWIAAEGQLASRFQFLSDLWSRIGFEIAKFRWGQTRMRQYILWGLTPVLGLLLYQIIFRSQRRRQQMKSSGLESRGRWPGLDSEFYQLESVLVARGLERGPSEPLSQWLARAVRDPHLAQVRAPLLELLRLHYRYRFDPQGIGESDRESLSRSAKECLGRVAQGRPV